MKKMKKVRKMFKKNKIRMNKRNNLKKINR